MNAKASQPILRADVDAICKHKRLTLFDRFIESMLLLALRIADKRAVRTSRNALDPTVKKTPYFHSL